MCGKHLRITVNHSYCHFGVRQQLDTLDFLLFLTTTVMFSKGKILWSARHIHLTWVTCIYFEITLWKRTIRGCSTQILLQTDAVIGSMHRVPNTFNGTVWFSHQCLDEGISGCPTGCLHTVEGSLKNRCFPKNKRPVHLHPEGCSDRTLGNLRCK